MRVEILWESPTGYLAACVNELSRNADVHVALLPPQANTEFDPRAMFAPTVTLYPWSPSGDSKPQLPTGRPDLLLVAGWMRRPYLRRAEQLRGVSPRLVAFDNQWRGTARQWAASIMRRFLIHPFFDMAFVPGDRQVRFARKLGFPSSRIRTGSYACDYELFSQQRTLPRDRVAIFAGRLVEQKGIDVLLAAYAQHRVEINDALTLVCVGSGPCERRVLTATNVVHVPFLQPSDLQRLLARATVLVLPSIWEPWGVILHEGAASGLPLIATASCGASDEFVTAANGWTIASHDARALATALNAASAVDETTWQSMSLTSRDLASRVTPTTWAKTLLEIVESPFNFKG